MRNTSRRGGREAGAEPEFVDPRDEVIEDFLGGAPRAEKWREDREALQSRYRDAVAARDQADPDDPDFVALEKRVRELRDQIAALAEEEAVTQFVEDSVRASLVRPRRPGPAPDGGEDDGEYGY